MMIFLDLFAGAGGTSTGIERAKQFNRKLAKVIACVNHDAMAIKSHARNHKKVLHFVEDVRKMDLAQLKRLIDYYRAKYPQAAFAIWASLECTNFSKAKGGKPRDADSRTLAEHLYSYVLALDPEYVFIENVVEFMSWGPLDDNGKPISKFEGVDYIKWKQQIESYGYRYDHRVMNAADYGAHTSRERYFAQFAKGDLPLQWPAATHAKKAKDGMFGSLKKWKPVKEVLDFSDEGNSIFGRKKDYSPKTLERVYAGLIKYVAGGKDNFLAKTYAVASSSDGTYSTEATAHTITTRDAHNLIQVERPKAFLSKYFSGKPDGMNIPVDGPAGTITTKDHHAIVQTKFLAKYYGDEKNHSSLEQPSGALTTKDRMSLVQTKWIDNQFIQGYPSSVEAPAGSITTVPKMNLVQCKNYLMNLQWNSSTAQSVDKPCFTLIARMDKAPPSIVSVVSGKVIIQILESDLPIVVKIKEFMMLYGIVDIKMRMLKIPELLAIQGFPKGYHLEGTQADQKKFIGNSVSPVQAEAIIKTSSLAFIDYSNLRMAA